MSRNENRIDTVIKPGDEIRLPKGTKWTSTGFVREGVLTRAQTVKVDHVSCGYVDMHNWNKRGSGRVFLPRITWSGTGGYWKTASVTLDLDGTLVLPEFDEYETRSFDMKPSLDAKPLTYGEFRARFGGPDFGEDVDAEGVRFDTDAARYAPVCDNYQPRRNMTFRYSAYEGAVLIKGHWGPVSEDDAWKPETVNA